MSELSATNSMTDPAIYTTPWPHQLEAYELSKDRKVFGLFMEQRTGKTKVAIDTASYLAFNGEIDALMIIAPNGVHRNWVTEELPVHAAFEYSAFMWRSNRAKNVSIEEERADLMRAEFPVLAVNVEAIRTDLCYRYCVNFLQTRRCLLVIDESQVIATPGAKQTKRVRNLGPRAAYRRILTGTPATESPFQLYSQFAFLDPAILGFKTYSAFKARYGEWSEGYAASQGRTYPKLEGYRNVEELADKIAPHSFRFRRDQFDGYVPKVYQKIFFQLTERQRRAYEKLRRDFELELRDGRVVTAAIVLTRYLRLQQIASNYWPASRDLTFHEPCEGEGCDHCGWLGWREVDVPTTTIDPDRNPRLEALASIVREEPGQIIIWARFHDDVNEVLEWCFYNDYSAAPFTGRVDMETRDEHLRRFKAGELKILVATTGAFARGRDARNAQLLVYYSNNFSLEQRLQSEDRAEDLNAVMPTQVVDLVAEDTVDEDIVDAHRSKYSLSAKIMKDPERKWL